MTLKHKITINVSDTNEGKTEVLRSADMRIPSRLIKFLFRDYRQVYLLNPGQSVESISVKVREGGKGNGKQKGTCKANYCS